MMVMMVNDDEDIDDISDDDTVIVTYVIVIVIVIVIVTYASHQLEGEAPNKNLCNCTKKRELNKTKGEYDKVSDQPILSVREMDENESGQMVMEKVKWTYFDAYLWHTIWNHAKKKSMEVKG